MADDNDTTAPPPQKPRRFRRPRGLRVLPINKMLPNIMTLSALAAGMTAIRFALQDQWEKAVFAIAIAAILDALDGRVARLLRGASKFGAELDSLSDFICFGVAPALMLYLWALQDSGRFGWVLVVLFAMCCGLRLARFNTMQDDEQKPTWAGRFFSGVPAPAGAGLVLLPMILSFQVDPETASVFRSPLAVSIALLIVGTLFVSTLPTYSFKNLKLAKAWVLPLMVATAVVAALVVSAPWFALSLMLALYLATFPLSFRSYMMLKKRSEGQTPPAADS